MEYGPLPLEGTRVLDLTQYAAGPFCTRMLADYGADVVKIEPPGGDPARRLPPFIGDEAGDEHSGTFLPLNLGKRSVVLDLKTAQGRERLLDLATSADALVESFSPGTLERLGLGYEALNTVNHRLVVTALTNFGQTGPYRDRPATDLTLYGMGGPMIGVGHVDHEPVRLAGRMAGYQAGIVAALATAIGLVAARARGEGEYIDVSMFEALTHSVELRLSQMLGYQYTGQLPSRLGSVSGVARGVYPCADGFVYLLSLAAHWRGLAQMVGHPELAERPEWQGPAVHTDPERIAEFDGYLYPWLLEHTKAEVRDACQQFGVMGAPLNTIADLLVDRNFVERGFFETIDHPIRGDLVYPGRPFRIDTGEGVMPPRRRAPLLGEHTAEVLSATPRRGASPPAPAPRVHARPLEGIRILDFTVVWAGPYATMHLADWGAEVIRVESLQHFPSATRGQLARPPIEAVRAQAAGAQWPPYPDEDPGERPWNRHSMFNSHARGKKSMTVDLTRSDGQELFERLVQESDGLLENNLPPHIEELGITWERLSAINPRLIMVRIPAFGVAGPYRDYRTMGLHMEALAGHPVIRAYPGYGLDIATTGVPADAASGAASAFAFVLGLLHRARTGRGLMAEVATAENLVPMLSEFVMDYTMNKRLWEHMGNEHWFLAPHNVYPCAGLERWVTIAVRNDEEWRALCGAMHFDELADDPRFAQQALRWEHRRELDPFIAQWTSTREPYWVAERLLSLGVPSGVVMNPRDVLDDPQHAARGFFQEIDYSETGRQRYVGPAWQASGTARPRLGPPPMLGEHNEYVYREILGYSASEYDRFVELRHAGTEYEPSVP